jgi:hypothetical protein
MIAFNSNNHRCNIKTNSIEDLYYQVRKHLDIGTSSPSKKKKKATYKISSHVPIFFARVMRLLDVSVDISLNYWDEDFQVFAKLTDLSFIPASNKCRLEVKVKVCAKEKLLSKQIPSFFFTNSF